MTRSADEIRDILKAESRRTVRHPAAEITIMWGGQGIDSARVFTVPEANNRASLKEQVIEPVGFQRKWLFCATEGTAAGSLPNSEVLLNDNNPPCVMPNDANSGFLVGWWGTGTNISRGNGEFAQPTILRIDFGPQTIRNFRLRGYLDDKYPNNKEFPTRFKVRAYRTEGDNRVIQKYSDGRTAEVLVSDNNDVDYTGEFEENLNYTTRLEFEILNWSHRNAFVKITAAFDGLTHTYDSDDILSLSILEEADGSIGTLPIGHISCNELNLTLQNIDDEYFIGNHNSRFAGMARNNRRIEPFVGFVCRNDADGKNEKILIPKGVYWSSDWNVSDQGTGASTTALDRLGRLQNIEYNGIGNIGNSDADAEASRWERQSLRNVAIDILTDLRNTDTNMKDLEFDIDEGLNDVVIEWAFFKKQSYFDVIKEIARAGLAYAYIDTPNQEEIDEAKRRGVRCVDILRIKRLEKFALDVKDDTLEEIAEVITQDDIVTKSITSKRDNLVNVVSVPWQAYQIAGDGRLEPVGDVQPATEENHNSILEYGRVEYEYPQSALIQTEDAAREIAHQILRAFSVAPLSAEVNTFGDVTRHIGNIWNLPEYQKKGIDSRGYYAVTRIQTEFDGSLRQSVTCRRATDKLPPRPELPIFFPIRGSVEKIEEPEYDDVFFPIRGSVEKVDDGIFFPIRGNVVKIDPEPDDAVDVRDGNRYKTVIIGNLEWLAEDFRYSANGAIGASAQNGNGLLYTLMEVYQKDPIVSNDFSSSNNIFTGTTIAMSGWRVPVFADFQNLTDAIAYNYHSLKAPSWHPSGNPDGFLARPNGYAVENGVLRDLAANNRQVIYWSAERGSTGSWWGPNNGQVAALLIDKDYGEVIRYMSPANPGTGNPPFARLPLRLCRNVT